MAASAGHVDRIKYKYPNSLSIFLFHSSHYSRWVSHNPLLYLWHLQHTERSKKLSILVTHHQRSRAQSKCLFLIRELKQPRQRRQQKPHKFAYFTTKNSSFACFARAFFIFWHFGDVLVLSKCQKMKNAHAKRAKLLFFIVKYANLWGFCCRCRRGYLSSLLNAWTTPMLNCWPTKNLLTIKIENSPFVLR